MPRKPKPRICRECGVALTDENWNPGDQKRNQLICKVCDAVTRQEHRKIRAAAPMPEGKHCRRCHVELTTENWRPGDQSTRDLICKICAAIERQQWEHARTEKLKLTETEGESKVCRKCGIELIAGVTAHLSRLACGDYICKPCYLEKHRKADGYYARREKPKYCRECGVLLVAGENASRSIGKTCNYNYICKACRKRVRNMIPEQVLKEAEGKKRLKRRIKLNAIQMYGGVCTCCGEERIEFLSIDHIQGGGTQERKQIRGNSFYRELLKQPVRDDLRVLCYNCNMAIGFYGYCPHERERNGTTKPFDDVSDQEIVKRASKRI
jgi:hypothetical protein